MADDLRDKLARAAARTLATRHGYAPDVDLTHTVYIDWGRDVADVLLPLVVADRQAYAAQALTDAADDPALAHVADVEGLPHRVVVASDLYARAAALNGDPR